MTTTTAATAKDYTDPGMLLSPLEQYRAGLISLPEYRFARGFITAERRDSWMARLAELESQYNDGLINRDELNFGCDHAEMYRPESLPLWQP